MDRLCSKLRNSFGLEPDANRLVALVSSGAVCLLNYTRLGYKLVADYRLRVCSRPVDFEQSVIRKLRVAVLLQFPDAATDHLFG